MAVLKTTDLPLLSKWTGLLYPKCQHSLYIFVASIMISFSRGEKKIINKDLFAQCEDIYQENCSVFYTKK